MNTAGLKRLVSAYTLVRCYGAGWTVATLREIRPPAVVRNTTSLKHWLKTSGIGIYFGNQFCSEIPLFSFQRVPPPITILFGYEGHHVPVMTLFSLRTSFRQRSVFQEVYYLTPMVSSSTRTGVVCSGDFCIV